MQTLVLALLLAAIFGLFAPSARMGLRSLLKGSPGAIWAVPFLLTAVFAGAAALAGALSAGLALLVLAYTAAPVAAVRAGAALGGRWPSPKGRGGGGWLDFAAVLLLWLPLEFAAGAALVPRPAQGFLHSVAYGIAILLALVLFIGYRELPGMKFNLPRSARDLWLPLAAFAIVAPVLAVVGVALGFVPPPHMPSRSLTALPAVFALIFAATALPEEILFRSLIQNLLMQRFGANARSLLAASLIFGAAHLNNGSLPGLNWRYMIVATIAGAAFGRVFQLSSSVVSSAALHALVNTTKHFFF